MHEFFPFLKKVNHASLMDQVYAHELAPSTKLTDTEVVEVLGNLFKLEFFMELRDIISFFKDKLVEAATTLDVSPTISSLTTDFNKAFARHKERTLYVGSKEASGYGMLSNFCVFVSEVLNVMHPNIKFKIDPEIYVSQGKTYAADQCVIKLCFKGIQVLVVWEYKPRVSTHLSDQTPWHISETFLQAFYLKKQHKYPVLHCLTDLADFHYFFVEGDGRMSLDLTKYVYLNSDFCNFDDTVKHVNFLLDSINIQ